MQPNNKLETVQWKKPRNWNVIKNLSKSQVLVAHSFWVTWRNISCTFGELCMEMPYWCTVLVHQYGCRKSTKTSGVHFSIKALSFHWETSICAHKHILELVILLKIKRRDFFHRDSIPILVSCTVKTQKFKLLYFRNETCYRTGNAFKRVVKLKKSFISSQHFSRCFLLLHSP